MSIKTIKLSKHEVDMKPALSWYEKEEVKAVMQSGSKMDNSGLKGFDGYAMLEAKIKLFECLIVEIREGENKIVGVREWLKTLSAEDGDIIDAAADEIGKKK
ncbi:MAG TPA: hypothetical protein VGE62_01095 [Candidatus Paceibacterota bacterium]